MPLLRNQRDTASDRLPTYLIVAAVLAASVALLVIARYATGIALGSFGETIADLVERTVGLAAPTHIAISIYGTLLARFVLWLVLLTVVAGGGWLMLRSLTGRWVTVLPIVLAGIAFTVCFFALPPLSLSDGGESESTRTALVLAMVVTLAFAAMWLGAPAAARLLPAKRRPPVWTLLVLASAAACGLAALIPNGYRLHALTGPVLGDSAVELVNTLDLNGLILDEKQRLLFATGHGADSLLAFRIDAMDEPPLAASSGTGRSEMLAFNKKDREVYLYDAENRTLLIVDADTLRLVGSRQLPNISPGDAVLEWDPASQRLMIASEADIREGDPLIILDRDGWKVVAHAPIEAGSHIRGENDSRVFLSFFRTTAELVVYDVKKLAVTASTKTHSKRFDRMSLDADRNEVLVAAPMESVIYRFDADTLRLKGSIAAVLGVRSMEIDKARRLLISVSLLSNDLLVTDLDTYEEVAHYRLGPWLRSVVLEPESGRAFVSSRYGMYVVDYLSRVQGHRSN